ncbi:MAG: carboxymuconolactone decarboxylase family protein [Acidobacteriota bacterium]
MAGPRISYVDRTALTDARMVEEFARADREGTPRPESHAIRAHVPAVFWSFVNTWNDVFRHGIVDVATKELCRVYVSKTVKCAYCGSQRSVDAAAQGVTEDDYNELLEFQRSGRYDDRQKAALSLADAITWDRNVDDAFWQRLAVHFSEAEIVELGYFIGFTMGQQRFNRLLNITVGDPSAADSCNLPR